MSEIKADPKAVASDNPSMSTAPNEASDTENEALQGAIKRILRKKAHIGYWEAHVTHYDQAPFDRVIYYDIA